METISLIGMLGICTFEDIKKRKIHIFFILLCGILGICFHLFFGRLSIFNVLGGLSVGGVLFLLSLATREKIGKGDALLLMVTGIYLGFWDNLFLLWLATVLASVVGVACVLVQKKGRSYELPFVPFVFIALLGLLAMKGGALVGG